MPSGLRRIHGEGDWHFLTFSCHGRKPYLNSPESRNIAEEALERTRRKDRFSVFGYVIMPEHIHALLSEPKQGTLAEAMKCWKLSVTLRRKERPFWEQRYYDFNVYSNKKHIEKLRYLHRNPVARGLVFKADDWSWSSFNHYATGIKRVVEIESQWTARLRESASTATPRSENPDPGHPSVPAP